MPSLAGRSDSAEAHGQYANTEESWAAIQFPRDRQPKCFRQTNRLRVAGFITKAVGTNGLVGREGGRKGEEGREGGREEGRGGEGGREAGGRGGKGGGRAGSRPISPLHVNRSDSLEIGVTYLQ